MENYLIALKVAKYRNSTGSRINNYLNVVPNYFSKILLQFGHKSLNHPTNPV
jgi:hypothetical protein